MFPSTTFDTGKEDHLLLGVSKMDPWTTQQTGPADEIVTSVIPSARANKDQSRSLDTLWQTKDGVYTATAIDDTWRSAIGMGGGRPWASKHHA